MAIPEIQRQGEDRYLISGELRMSTVPALAQRAGELLAGVRGQVTVDLAGVDRADSAGLALLLELQRLSRREGFEIRFHALPEQLLQILRLSELEEILPISA